MTGGDFCAVGGCALLNALGKIYVRYNLKSHFERIIHDDVPVPVIVCSEGLME